MIKIRNCRYGPRLFPANDKWAGRSFDLYGEAYQQQIDFMEEFIRPGDVIIDAGANIGAMTVPFSLAVGEEGQVIAFEPQEFLYYVLCGNIAANNLYNTMACCQAISDISGQTLYCPSARLKNDDGVPFYDDYLQHFGGVYLTEEPRFESDNKVKTISIDDLELQKLDFIKLDIEGAELKALAGARKSLEKFKPILFMESMPWSLPKLIEALKGLDYVYRSCRMRFFNPDNFFGNPVDELREAHAPDVPMMSSDVLCYHRSQQADMDLRYFRAVKECL